MANLKPGGMGLSTEVGMPAAFQSSMAAAIEAALNNLLPGEGRDTLPVNDNSPETRDRRLFFCAVAQGVVNHLRNNADAFKVHLHFTGGIPTSATITIETQ
jgi:hypothetical protein